MNPDFLTEIVLAVLSSAALGYLLNRLRRLEQMILDKPDRKEVNQQIEDKQGAIKAVQVEQKEDLKEIKEYCRRLEDKIDKLSARQ